MNRDDPLARELERRAAADPFGDPPDIGDVPSTFEDWALEALREGRLPVARLAGLLLARCRPSRLDVAARLVRPLARAADLPLLRSGLAPGLRRLLDELNEAAEALPAPIADALVMVVLQGALLEPALALLLRNTGPLEGFRPRTGGALEPLLARVLKIATDREREQMAARPRVEALLRAATKEAARLGDPRLVTEAELERAVARVEVPQPDLALLELVVGALEGMPGLVAALALVPAVSGTPLEKMWAGVLRERASWFIHALGARGLLELRVRLLAALIEASTDPQHRWFFARANARLNAGTWDARVEHLVRRDLERALEGARRDGDPDGFADSVAVWAKLVASRNAQDRSMVARAEELLAEALSSRVSPECEATLLQARAYVVRIRDPRAAADIFEEASGQLATEDPLRWELAAEAIATLTAAGAAPLAGERAEHLLRAAPAGGTSSDVGVTILMIEAAEAFFVAGRSSTSVRGLLEDALARARGVDVRLEATIHLRLARFALGERDVAAAERHLAHALDHAHALDPGIRTDAHQIEAEILAARRDTEGAAKAVSRAIDVARGAKDELGVRLHEASLLLREGRIPDGLDALIAGLLRNGELGRGVVDLLEQIACNHGRHLSPGTRSQLIEWAHARGRWSVQARLLRQGGDDDGARDVLRGALAVAGGDQEERLACAAFLVTILGPGDREEQVRLCDEIERLIGDRDDVPRIRMDLATVLRANAEGESSRLLRAWRHGLRALPGLHDAEAVHGHGELARIVREHARATLGRPSEERAELAAWLSADHPSESVDIPGRQLEVALHLLAPGPLSRSDDVNLARKLVAAAERSAGVSEQSRLLRARCDWIDDSIRGAVWSGARPGPVGPFDGASTWLIALFAGRRPDVDGGPADQADEVVSLHLHAALDARPDRADEVLAALVTMSARLDRDAARLVIGLAHEAVRDQSAWPRTREALSSAPALPDAGPGDAVQRLFEEARRLMDGVRRPPLPRDAGERIGRARSLLEEAVDLARKHGLPDLFNMLVSLGNAWKTPPGPDVETALARYAEAEALGGEDEQLARLWKVKADALRDRGADEDLRDAASLLEKSVSLRSGSLRAESLASAALVAAAHPDLDDAERAARAAEFLVEAARAAPRTAEPLLPDALLHLGRWARLRPPDPRPVALVTELRSIFPDRRAELTLGAGPAGEAAASRLDALLEHPVVMAFLRETTGFALDGAAPPASSRDVQALFQARVEQAFSDADLLERRLQTLSSGGEHDEAPGMAVARVVLLAGLARLGRRRSENVREATDEAARLVAGVADGAARGFLLRELSRVWAPVDHLGDPIRDFALAANLATRAIDAEGGEERASLESLEHRARAVRYDVGDKLTEARDLYERLVARARADGQVDHLASALAGLADIARHEGGGTRAARLRAGVRILEEAVSLSTSPMVRARLVASLAWARTDAALAGGSLDRTEELRRASREFDQVEVELLSAHERRLFETNRAVCGSSLAQGGEEQVREWRARLAEATSSHDRATAQHNLAQALISGPITRDRLIEAVSLCEAAAPVRANDARHAFQTAMVAGGALTLALEADEVLLPWSQPETWARARGWLQQAVLRARGMGPGSDLALAGLALGHVACCAPTLGALSEAAEEAWVAVREAAPFVLFDRALREREAEVASEIAVALARRLGSEAIASPGVAFLLSEDRAETVLRWILRAQVPLRRPLKARLAAPAGVSVALWQEWLGVVGTGDPLELVRVLGQIREKAPEFLEGEGTLDTTWRWLEAQAGRIGVSVEFASPVSIAALLSVDHAGRRDVHVLGLEVPPPPHDAESLASTMRQLVDEDADAATRSHADMTSWARRAIVDPILRFHAGVTTEVLWAPGRGLRAVAPASLWDVPVSCTTGLDLPMTSGAALRPRSTLLALADPGPGAGPLAELGDHGRAALTELAVVARDRGVVRRLASAGPRYGAALLGQAEDLRERPASAADILGEAREHDVIVLIAHGEAADPADAALLCVSESGATERLDVTALGRAPEAFRGALVILLSCETGRVGEDLAEPGGIAGALVAAGARAVVGPLWPVRLDVAVAAARAVLRAIEAGESASVALARFWPGTARGGPSLGPAPAPSAQREAAALERSAFVTWVG